ncbi:hypothetical protein QBC36DRAFT_363318 [Triangularia setosa]|uniref:Zn(2)-C6 fungal-type domain-containing protein n=1 Tax=Triangularia setosa TaxID=2587417 RepID=A0AAN6W0S0_9PEZI|nr:hypothetical protein QBC36DRAFT_363318 [Podospora setosa]
MAFQNTFSHLGRPTPKVTSIESRIDAVDISKSPNHADQSQDPDIDNELRLDDISRRSACDRCRGMKMRCERPHKQYISQLQQCRRCRQANVRCITTLEAERHDDIDKRSQRSRKRSRQYSTKANNNSLSVPPALGRRLDEQHHEHNNNTLPFEHRHERIMTEMLRTRSPSIHAFSRSEDGMLPPLQDIHNQHYELRNVMAWDGSGAMFSLQGDDHHHQTRAISVPPPASDVAPSLPQNPTPEDGTFLENITSSSEKVQSTAGATFSGTFQESHAALFGAGMPLLSSPHGLPDSPTPPTTEVRWKIMNKLMEFKSKVLHDLHDLRGLSRARGGDDKGTLMVKTLQYSDMMLELLSNFTRSGGQRGARPGEFPADRTCSPYSPSSGTIRCSRPGGGGGGSSTPSGGWDEKVDTDLALLLLSCNTNVSRLYELLCMDLAIYSGLHPEEALLSSLRLEGLQTLDAETRVQVLVHICFLKFTKIQSELESIRRLGLLTETADKAFQVVLGNGGVMSPGYHSGLGMEQIVDQFRRRVMAMEHSF